MCLVGAYDISLKIVQFIQKVYINTKAVVWTGSELFQFSDLYEVNLSKSEIIFIRHGGKVAANEKMEL